MTITLINRTNYATNLPIRINGKQVELLIPDEELTLTLAESPAQLSFALSHLPPITVTDGDRLILTPRKPASYLYDKRTRGFLLWLVGPLVAGFTLCLTMLGWKHWLTIGYTLFLLGVFALHTYCHLQPHFTLTKEANHDHYHSQSNP